MPQPNADHKNDTRLTSIMKTLGTNLNSPIGLLTAALLAVSATARSADMPTLKDAYKDHFYVGVAINRTIATGTRSGPTTSTGTWSRSTKTLPSSRNSSTRFPRRTT